MSHALALIPIHGGGMVELPALIPGGRRSGRAADTSCAGVEEAAWGLEVEWNPRTSPRMSRPLQAEHSAPPVKQYLACIRMLLDWLVSGQVVSSNPASMKSSGSGFEE